MQTLHCRGSFRARDCTEDLLPRRSSADRYVSGQRRHLQWWFQQERPREHEGRRVHYVSAEQRVPAKIMRESSRLS